MKFKYLYVIILIFSLVSIVSAATPVSNFTSNVSSGLTYPLVVAFTDDSTNIPTSWNWSFGDGRWYNTTSSASKNTTYQYTVAGKYTVNLTVSNGDGTNTKSMSEMINLTSDNDANLTSWLHMNGTNTSTTFSDEKGLAWSTSGGAQISTLRYKYGESSGRFDGSGDYITTPNSSALSFGTGNFTIEFWMNVTTVAGTNEHVFSKSNSARNSGWGMDRTASGAEDSGWDFWMGNDSAGQVFFNAPIQNKTWVHIAIERRAGTIYLYVNGNLTNSSAGFNANYDTSELLWIGRQSTNYYDGYVDEFRISKVARWTSNFTPPYNEYRGTLETIYPDINPNSTFRYKTDPTGIAYIDNITQRNRTLQIQNITNTSYIVGETYFDSEHTYIKSVQLNLSYYPTGMTLLSYDIDNENGLVSFNISKPTGFSPGINRASILDYTLIYNNYTDNNTGELPDYFAYGYLVNGSTNQTYAIHNFLGTPVTYGDWNFTANFTASNLTPATGTITTFVSTFNGSYPNRWNWSFGDGTFDNGTNSTTSHIYITGGLKTVTLTEYLYQNGSVNNTTINLNYINVTDTLPIADFTSVISGTTVPVTVDFTDASINYPIYWNWTFGDGNTSILQNPTHIYETCGNFTVGLRSGNTLGWSAWNNKTNHVSVSGCGLTPTPTPTPTQSTSDKLATKTTDTQNLINIGVIIIIISGLVAFAISFIIKK